MSECSQTPSGKKIGKRMALEYCKWLFSGGCLAIVSTPGSSIFSAGAMLQKVAQGLNVLLWVISQVCNMVGPVPTGPGDIMFPAVLLSSSCSDTLAIVHVMNDWPHGASMLSLDHVRSKDKLNIMPQQGSSADAHKGSQCKAVCKVYFFHIRSKFVGPIIVLTALFCRR